MTVLWASVAEYGVMYNLFCWFMMAVGWYLQDFPGVIGLVIIPDFFMTFFWVYRTYNLRFSHLGAAINGDYCKKWNHKYEWILREPPADPNMACTHT